MTFADCTDPSQTAAIAFDFDLHHPPAKVWRALTDPALLAEWLLPAIGFRPEPGTAFTLTAPPQPGWDGRVNGCVIEVDAERKLSYRWVVGDLDTVVTFTLTATTTGARLVVVQSGFAPDQKRNFGGARYGWKMMGGRLVALLDNLA